MAVEAFEGVTANAVQGRISAWLRQAADVQEGRLFLWSPVALTLGIWAYFALPVEPPVWTTLLAAVPGVLAAGWWGRNRPWMLICAIMLGGFVLVKARAEWIAAPVIRATSPEVAVTATVLKADAARFGRLTITVVPEAVEGLAPSAMPRKLRLSLRAKQGAPRAGERIAFKARLSPLPSPVMPGGFDYGRRLWFEGIGGTGRVVSQVDVLGGAPGISHSFERAMSRLRDVIGSRIKAHLDEPVASFAQALITGERATIPDAVNQSLMASGLFHVLSISGLHMWLVAGGVFWAVRAVLALSPRLALRYPIKKWAAAAALLMGFFYLLLADSGVATERSFIMIAIVFFAVMVDRPALSIRNLAVAALLVLVLQPDAAIDASFQMSFLAVLGLAAFYEWWSAREADNSFPQHRPWPGRLVQAVARAAFLALVTTAIASTMSSIPAAYHFGRLAPYGLVANGLAFPVISLLIMPMALASAVLMPFGLEAVPLTLMGKGLEVVMAISDWVAGFPGARVIVAQPPEAVAIVLSFAAVAFCLLRGHARIASLGLAAAGVALALWGKPQPDILIERSGGNAAIRSEHGLLVPASARRSRFTVEKWLQANGEETAAKNEALRSGWQCADDFCRASVRGAAIGYAHGKEGKALDCRGLAIVIADFPLRGQCRYVPTRIDRFDLWRGGARAIYIEPGGPRMVTTRGVQGERPWSINPEARKRFWRLP